MSASGESRNKIVAFAPSDILSDPDRFQSRAEYPRDVTDTDLSDVEVFDEFYANVLSVWRDPYSRQVYVVDGHRRLELAKRTRAATVSVQFLGAGTDAEAFAKGVALNIAQWVFQGKDKVAWASESRRAAVERAFHTGWLDPRTEAAKELFEFYPDLQRRYCG